MSEREREGEECAKEREENLLFQDYHHNGGELHCVCIVNIFVELCLHSHTHTHTHTHTITQVRTQLAHPTNYHVSEVQRKQVKQFLTQHGTPIQTRSAPAHNLTAFGMPRAASLGGAQKDPLLSGAMGASGSSPLKPNSFNPTMGSPIKHSPVNPCE